MKHLLLSLLISFFLFSSTTISQNPEWINYFNGDCINTIEMEDDFVWVATTGGLAKINSLSGETTIFNKLNSGLPTNIVTSIAIDKLGNKWFGTGDAIKSWNYGGGPRAGLVKFDGTSWVLYDTTNSGLTSNNIHCISIDSKGYKWIGTDKGLVKFDGTNWVVFNESNSSLPSNFVSCIAIDELDNKWIGTAFVCWGYCGSGMAKLDTDDTTWTLYNSSNSGLPCDEIFCIEIDGLGTKWIGTAYEGLAGFDDTTWTYFKGSHFIMGINCITIDENKNKWIGLGETYPGSPSGVMKIDSTDWERYTTANSGIPEGDVNCIKIDKMGNKWIGTESGLAVFNEGGVVTDLKNNADLETMPKDYVLYQNFPNPFNPSTTIKYALPFESDVTLTIYDISGQEVYLRGYESQPPGDYTRVFDATNYSSGVYFYMIEAIPLDGKHKLLDVKKMIILK